MRITRVHLHWYDRQAGRRRHQLRFVALRPGVMRGFPVLLIVGRVR